MPVRGTMELEFSGDPVAKPRMTQRDKWQKRPIVEKYWAFKDAINAFAVAQEFKLANSYRAKIYIAMPVSWSKKKRDKMRLQPHKQRPDLDNFLKAIQDALFGIVKNFTYICRNI